MSSLLHQNLVGRVLEVGVGVSASGSNGDQHSTPRAPAGPGISTDLGRGVLCRWRLRGGVIGPASAPLVERALASRNITDPSFLDPKLSEMHSPSLIPDMDKAAERILRALKQGEPVVIYGDYDVDGVTSTSILFHMMRELEPEADVRTYVPHRVDEGYGLAIAAIEQLAADGAKVIVSVDCGVTATEPAKCAKRLGVDLIITDHHNPPEKMEDLPDAYAVVHPRRPDSQYPFGELSGAGVAYKLAWRMATMHFGSPKLPQPLREMLIELLAFAALGAVADIVPLLGENRVLTKFGMMRIKESRFIGLRALVRAARLDSDSVSTYDVGFKLGPRLNACGRMAHAERAVHLFTRATVAEADVIAKSLETLNEERRATEKEIFKQAAAMVVEKGMDKPDCRGIVLANADWHVGVVGIVCSRLVERFCKPTILMGQKDGHWHGSGRSVDGVSLHAAIARAGAFTVKFGGHDMAAGLAVSQEQYDDFVRAFTQACRELVADENMVPKLTVDAIAAGHEISLAVAKTLRTMEPCGAGNPHVKLLVRDLELYSNPKPLGKTGEHMRLTFRFGGGLNAGVQSGACGFVIVTAWSWARRAELLRVGSRYDIVVKLGVNEWNGNESVEATLEDLRETAAS